jgi:hypothetical protein
MATTSFQNLMIAHPGAMTLSTTAAVRPAALSEVMFRVNRPLPTQPTTTAPSSTPLLSDDDEMQLKKISDQASPHDFRNLDDSNSQKKLRPLTTWLADPITARITCTQNNLLISMSAIGDASAAEPVQLFPLNGDITATITNLPDKSPALTVSIDPDDRRLDLSLLFTDDEGRALYGSLVKAMQAPEPTVSVMLSFTHNYAVMVTPPAHGPGIYHLNPTLVAKPMLMTSGLKATAFQHPMHPMPPVSPPAPAPQPHRDERSATLQFTFPIGRSVELKPDPYPDYPKANPAQTWQSWDPNVQDNVDLRVYFKPSVNPGQVFYLPTVYKLGFFADDQGGLQAPITAQNYRNGDEYRVKVRLLALPYIDDAVRENLRAYLCSATQPFVQLIPAAGMKCEFTSDIVPVSESSTSGQNLPASIQFTAAGDLAPDKRLTFGFDMNAFDYALFGEILKHGIRGTLQVSDDTGFSLGIDVSMKLGEGEVIANSLDFELDTDTTSNQSKVTINNRLDFPVELSSARIFFVKYSKEIDGLVFKSDFAPLLPADGQTTTVFAKKGDDQASLVLPLTPPGVDWGSYAMAVVLGTAIANAGSAQDWLNRVNQDPSLQPQQFKIHLDLFVHADAKPAIQTILIKVYRDGDPAPRKNFQLLPTSPGADLIVDMTLAELMGSGGKNETFSLEYYGIYEDQSLGLPQRVAIDFTTPNLVLTALQETPTSIYTLFYDDETGEHHVPGDRASTEAAISKLRDANGHWWLLARAPTPQDSSTTTPAGPPGA